uniref:Uncharacterized protein n=1 Tax=Desertifilum tharense IPPAS B-1220 TaxID=1781255 RepID=A0ACD5GT70_9CYAN
MQAQAKAIALNEIQTLEYQLPDSLEPDARLRNYEARIVAMGADETLFIVRDITERKRYEAELVRRSRHATLQSEISLSFTQSGSLNSLLQRCCQSLVQHLDAAFARIWLLNANNNCLELKASAVPIHPPERQPRVYPRWTIQNRSHCSQAPTLSHQQRLQRSAH